MRENDGRKLDHHTLEQMRLRAVDAVESGVHPEDVAASLGMGRGTVYGWLAKYREGGREALKARPVPGKWSTLEVVCHLVDSEQAWCHRMKRVIAEDNPLLREPLTADSDTRNSRRISSRTSSRVHNAKSNAYCLGSAPTINV